MSQRYSSSFCSNWVVPSALSATTTTITSPNSPCFSTPPNAPRDSNTPPPAPKKKSVLPVRSKPTQQHRRYTRVYPPSWTASSRFPPTPISPPSTYRSQADLEYPPSVAATPTPAAANIFSPAPVQTEYIQLSTMPSSQQHFSGGYDASAKLPAGYDAHAYSTTTMYTCITAALPPPKSPYPPKPPMTREAPWNAPGRYAYPEIHGGYIPSPFSGAADQPAHPPQVSATYSPAFHM